MQKLNSLDRTPRINSDVQHNQSLLYTVCDLTLGWQFTCQHSDALKHTGKTMLEWLRNTSEYPWRMGYTSQNQWCKDLPKRKLRGGTTAKRASKKCWIKGVNIFLNERFPVLVFKKSAQKYVFTLLSRVIEFNWWPNGSFIHLKWNLKHKICKRRWGLNSEFSAFTKLSDSQEW